MPRHSSAAPGHHELQVLDRPAAVLALTGFESVEVDLDLLVGEQDPAGLARSGREVERRQLLVLGTAGHGDTAVRTQHGSQPLQRRHDPRRVGHRVEEVDGELDRVPVDCLVALQLVPTPLARNGHVPDGPAGPEG
jgi:hypothetical protein